MHKQVTRGLIAFAAVASLTLAGCSASAPEEGSSADDPQAPAEITFLTFQSPNLTEQFWEDQVAEIQKTYPNLTVNLEYTPGLDRQDYAKQLLATGTLPDVIWDVPLQDFVSAGALLPYSSEDLAGIDAPEGSGTIDGEHYSLTVGAQVIPLIYYNKDEFDALGIEEPTTFSELKDAAATIAAAGKTPFLIGGGADSWASTIFLDGIITSDVIAADPQWTAARRAGDVSFTDPDFEAAVKKWLDLSTSGYFNSDALSVDYSQLQSKFANGEGVMYPMGSWAGASQVDFNVGVFALPSSSGDYTLGLNYGQALAVSATTKFPAQAKAFAVAMATGQGANLAQLKADSVIPVAKGFEAPTDIPPLISKTFDAYQTDGAAYVEPFGWTQGQNALPSGFTAEFDKGAQQLLSGSTTVKDFLAQMDKTFDDLDQG
ncbi:multiple sugar transport system substrate-binding protein [Salinibacterium sp. CAN_S4]|uniref:ABC transporter substrate-binding protein n=1 Tax=Salinibacterium sp. CAN_S4 TaxID=2787727 RepID=UPI0018EFB664